MGEPRDRRWFLGAAAGAGAAAFLRRPRQRRRNAYAAAATVEGNVPVTIANTGSFNPGTQLFNARPNDGSGMWPDFSNTGYLHDPGYTGTGGNCVHGYAGLNDYQAGMTTGGLLQINGATNATFNQIHFRGRDCGSGGASVGNWTGALNWTFNGCVFDGVPLDNLTYFWGQETFNYCTFKPVIGSGNSLPPGNNGTVTSSHTSPGTLCADSYEMVSGSYGPGSFGTGGHLMTKRHCDIWGNAGMNDVFGGSAAQHALLDHCYIHDQADTDSTGGCGYHHDGIGPTTDTETGYIDVMNCTVASLGNTEGFAMETTNGTQLLHDCVLKNNYWSGWGYTLNFGGSDHLRTYNITFEGNVYSAEMGWIFGPMFANWAWNSGGAAPTGNTGMLWRNNYWTWRAGDLNTLMDATFQGQFWHPTDNAAYAADYTG